MTRFISHSFTHSSLSQRPAQAIIITIFTSLMLSLVGCSNPKESPNHAPERSSNSVNPHPASTNPTKVATTATSTSADTALSTQTLSSAVTTQSTSPALANKQLVINAKATFEVDDVVQSANQIEALTLQNGGYIANSNIDNKEVGRSNYAIGNQQQKQLIRYVRQATMQVRVPKNQVSAFLNQLQSQIKFLENSQFSAKDVTLDIKKAQLEAQIQASKQTALENQNLANKNEKTQSGNVEVINATALASQEKAYAELQKDAVLDQINLSTIELNFSQPEKLRTEIVADMNAVIGEEKTQTFGSRLLDNLKSGWLYFMEFVLFLSQLWVFLLGIGLLVWLIRWWHRRTAHLKVPKISKIRKSQISEKADSDPNHKG